MQQSRSQLSSLTARVDRLQERAVADEIKINDLSRKLDMSEHSVHDLSNQISIRSDRDTIKLQQMVNEVMVKQRAIDSSRQEQDTQNRAVLEQMNHMQYKVESYILKTEQVGSDLTTQSRDWSVEAQKGNTALRALKDHDQALQSLHTVVDSSTDTIIRKFETAQYEMRQRLDSEQRARAQFENNMRDLCSEWRKIVQNQERDILNRMDSVRQGLQAHVEREGELRQQLGSAIADERSNFEKKILDSQMGMMEQFSQQIGQLEQTIVDERRSNKDLESRISSSFDQNLSHMQSSLSNRIAQISEQGVDTKSSITLVAKALQDSIMISEKANSSKLKSLEDVLRAEVKSRLDTDATITNLSIDVQAIFERCDGKIQTLVQSFRDNFSAEMMGIVNGFKAKAESTNLATERQIAMIEGDIERISKNSKLLDGIILKNDKRFSADLVAMSTLFAEKLLETRNELATELNQSDKAEGENHLKLEQLDARLEEFSEKVEARFSFKTSQLDSSMEAMKEELLLKYTNESAKDVLERIEQVEKGQLLFTDHVQRLEMISAECKQFVVKNELEKTQQQLEKSIIELDEKTQQQLEKSIIELDVHHKALVEKLEQVIKKSLAEKHEKQTAKSESIELFAQQIAAQVKACLKKADFEQEKVHISALIEESKGLANKQQSAIQSIGQLIVEKASRTEIELIGAGLTSSVNDINDTINAMQIQFVRNKEDIAHQREQIDSEIDSLNERLKSANILTKSDVQKQKQENEKRLSDLHDHANRLEIQASKHHNHLNLIQNELAERSRTFNDKIQDINESLGQISDGRDDQHEEVLQQIEILEGRINQICSAKEEFNVEGALQTLHDEVAATRQNMESQNQECHQSFDQIYKRISEQEDTFKDRAKMLNSASERVSKECSSSIRAVKDALNRKIDTIEPRVKGYNQNEHKQETNQLRSDTIATSQKVSKIENQLSAIRNQISDTISQRRCEGMISTTVEPILNKIADLNERLNRPRSSFSKHSTGNFYKPAQIELRTANSEYADHGENRDDESDARSEVQIV